MELLNFAEEFPEIYAMLDDDVNYMIEKHNMKGEESITNIDSMIDSLMSQFEANDYYGFNGMESQQMDEFGRDDRDRRRRRRRFRDFDIRDITRLLFFRNLFDRRHRR